MIQNRPKLRHEVMMGSAIFDLEDGTTLDVQTQKHTLWRITELWDKDSEQWVEQNDREDVDEFYLTGIDSGYRFDEEILMRLLKTEEYPEWDFNSSSEKDYDQFKVNEIEVQEKWKKHKEKFPIATTIDQFTIKKL